MKVFPPNSTGPFWKLASARAHFPLSAGGPIRSAQGRPFLRTGSLLPARTPPTTPYASPSFHGPTSTPAFPPLRNRKTCTSAGSYGNLSPLTHAFHSIALALLFLRPPSLSNCRFSFRNYSSSACYQSFRGTRETPLANSTLLGPCLMMPPPRRQALAFWGGLQNALNRPLSLGAFPDFKDAIME